MFGSNPTSVFKGALLTVAMRWTDRLIGFISTLVLARLLVPEDFGVIAMASLVIGLIDVFLDLGVNVALIQNRNATQAHYDTAWTLRLVQSCLVTLIVFLAAPYAAEYFNDPRVTPVLQWLAAGVLLAGLENIGVITFQKEMRFSLDFRFTFLKRIAGFFTTITAAAILQNFWALVIGTLVGRLIGVILSYFIHPMRPRLSMARFSEIFAVSQWMLVRSIGIYLDANLHRILVGRRSDTAIMGGYSLANEISAMPSTELLAPVNRVLFPAFVRARDDLAELRRLFLLAQGLQCLIGIPAGVGLALVAEEAVLVLLGEKWLLAVPFVQLLALANVVQAITTSGGYVMMTLGRMAYVALLSWAQVALFVVLAVSLLTADMTDAAEIAVLRLVSGFIGLVLALWLLMQVLHNLRLRDIFGTVFRPLFAAGLMSLSVLWISEYSALNPFWMLVLKIVLGISVYSCVICLVWWAAGKPAGAETYLFDKLRYFLNRRNTAE